MPDDSSYRGARVLPPRFYRAVGARHWCRLRRAESTGANGWQGPPERRFSRTWPYANDRRVLHAATHHIPASPGPGRLHSPLRRRLRCAPTTWRPQHRRLPWTKVRAECHSVKSAAMVARGRRPLARPTKDRLATGRTVLFVIRLEAHVPSMSNTPPWLRTRRGAATSSRPRTTISTPNTIFAS